ncbi:MAG: methylmalonyl-CoA mutase family protein, partial [Phycisphaerae bacterium]
VRRKRDEGRVRRALQRVGADATAGSNVMPGIVEAVKEYATVGEITNSMVEVYGRYEEPIRF